jgi:hypothetical protein
MIIFTYKLVYMNEIIQFFENEVAGKTANQRLIIVLGILLFFGLLTVIVSL